MAGCVVPGCDQQRGANSRMCPRHWSSLSAKVRACLALEVGQSPIRDQMWADAASMIANGEAVAVDLEVNPPKVARRALTAIRADNGRRVPCPHCQLMCLPETLARHVSFCRDDGEAVRRSTSRVPSNQPPAGSGSRPDATPVPVPSKPAGATAGALSRLPETHRE